MMANIVMDHGASWCFGTSLAPRCSVLDMGEACLRMTTQKEKHSYLEGSHGIRAPEYLKLPCNCTTSSRRGSLHDSGA